MTKENKYKEIMKQLNYKPIGSVLLRLYGVMCRTLSNTFFKYGINVFDSRLKKYGGFNHFLAGTIFRWRYHYLTIYLKKEFKIERIHRDDDYYYDGYHNSLWLGWVLISYGT